MKLSAEQRREFRSKVGNLAGIARRDGIAINAANELVAYVEQLLSAAHLQGMRDASEMSAGKLFDAINAARAEVAAGTKG